MGRNKKLQEIDLSLNSLVVFRKLLTHEVILPLRALLDTDSMDPMIQLRQYTEFISRLYARSTNLTEYVFQLICEDDNFYVKAVAAGEKIDPEIVSTVKNELNALNEIGQISSAEIRQMVLDADPSGGRGILLPKWKTEHLNLVKDFTSKLSEISRTGSTMERRK